MQGHHCCGGPVAVPGGCNYRERIRHCSFSSTPPLRYWPSGGGGIAAWLWAGVSRGWSIVRACVAKSEWLLVRFSQIVFRSPLKLPCPDTNRQLYIWNSMLYMILYI